MDPQSDIVSAWKEHQEWGISTREFERRIADYCSNAVPEAFVADSALIIRELVCRLLEEPLKAIGVLIESQRKQLELVLQSFGDGLWRIGYEFRDPQDLHLEVDQDDSYHETTLSDPLPLILLFVLKKFMSLAGQHKLFDGTIQIAAFERSLMIYSSVT